jgi:hypothetical protein
MRSAGRAGTQAPASRSATRTTSRADAPTRGGHEGYGLDNHAEILRRVAGVLLTLISMSAVLGTVLAMIVGAVVRDWIARDKALREAAADTPGIRQAVITRGDRAADHQQWIHGVELWLRQRLPGLKTRKTEVPTLKAIEAPKIEDPAA